MAELTKEYFDKHYEELNEFLSVQFEKVFSTMATKADISALDKKMTDGFTEQSIKLDFMRTEIASIKTDLAELSKRTREDDNAFNRELQKLKDRVDELEKKLKVLTPEPA